MSQDVFTQSHQSCLTTIPGARKVDDALSLLKAGIWPESFARQCLPYVDQPVIQSKQRIEAHRLVRILVLEEQGRSDTNG